MKLSRSIVAAFSGLTLGLVVSTAAVIAQSSHVVPADKVQWGPAPAILPAGAQLAVLEGNPGAKGALVLRLKMPANYKIPAHWHSMDEHVTVLSGTFNIGMGEALDAKASQALAPGGFVSLPAKMHHFAWTSAPTVVQINLEGPFDLFYVNANDDPQKNKSR